MKKIINRVIIPIVVFICAVISISAGSRIYKTFMGVRNYKEVQQEKWDNNYFTVQFKNINKISTNYANKEYYIGELSDGTLVVVLKDPLYDKPLVGNTDLKGFFMENSVAVNDIKQNMTDENEKEKYSDKLSKYIVVTTQNPYRLTVSVYIQCCLGFLIIIGIIILKVKKKL